MFFGVIDNVHPESMHIRSSGLSIASHHLSGCSVGLSRLILSMSACAAFRADLFAIATAVRRGFRDDLVCLGGAFVAVEIISFLVDVVIMDGSVLAVEFGGSFVCVKMISFSGGVMIMDGSSALVYVISFISLSMSCISVCVCVGRAVIVAGDVVVGGAIVASGILGGDVVGGGVVCIIMVIIFIILFIILNIWSLVIV